MISDVENGGSGGRRGGSGEQIDGGGVERSTSFTTTYQPPQQREKVYPAMETLLLAYQSLGVVYGDLGTSPVNVFSSTRSTNLSEEDLLGTLSLIIWTLKFLVLIKYAFIVLHANDHGEGGTFALYSYICRHVSFTSTFSIQNTRLESESEMETETAYYSRGSSLSRRTKKFLEGSCFAQNVVTVIVLLGTCMVIGDGALTPATLCSLSASRNSISSDKITQDELVWISVALLVALFAFQRCGTGKVSFLFSPIMLVWFGTNVTIGVYNIIKYYPSILKTASPYYTLKFL